MLPFCGGAHLSVAGSGGLTPKDSLFGDNMDPQNHRSQRSFHSKARQLAQEPVDEHQLDREHISKAVSTARQPLGNLGSKLNVLESTKSVKPLASAGQKFLKDFTLKRLNLHSSSSPPPPPPPPNPSAQVTCQLVSRGLIVDIDAETADNHLHCQEYQFEILAHLRDLETRYNPSPNYLTKQNEITEAIRADLIYWIFEVSEGFHLVSETVFLVVNYVDRFMSKKQVRASQIYLLALTAMFVASKYEEVEACSMSSLMEVVNNELSVHQMRVMEVQLLRTLKYDLNIATIRCFAARFIAVASHMVHKDVEVFSFLVYFLTELSLVHYPMLKYSASKIAAVAVILSLDGLHLAFWNRTLAHHFQYKLRALLPCAQELLNAWRNAHFGPRSTILMKKYARNEYRRVSEHLPPAALLTTCSTSQIVDF